jgi:hypothetical protein
MISIKLKNYSRSPRRLTIPACIRQIQRAASNRNGAICTGNYYRDNTVRNLLKAYSIGKRKLNKKDKPKCFYCESKGEAMLSLEVEHYRPKDGLEGRDLIAGQSHNGYYWLGNEWSNLLLSCRSCNGADAKGMRFPISNKPNRISHDQPVNAALVLNRSICLLDSTRLLPESPVLLNPEFDIPENHLTFNDRGQIKSIAGSTRGQQTIQILKLFRDPLFAARQDVLNDFRNDINVLVQARVLMRLSTDGDLEAGFELICRKILSRKHICSEYSLWGTYINNNIERLIVSRIPAPYKQVFRDAYQYAIANP